MALGPTEACSPSACGAVFLFPSPHLLSPETQPQLQGASLPTQGHSDLAPPNLLEDLCPEREHLLPRLGISCRCTLGLPTCGGHLGRCSDCLCGFAFSVESKVPVCIEKGCEYLLVVRNSGCQFQGQGERRNGPELHYKMLFDPVQERWPVQQSCLQGTPKLGVGEGSLSISAVKPSLYLSYSLHRPPPWHMEPLPSPPTSPRVVSLL